MTKNIYAQIERIVEEANKCKEQIEIVGSMLEKVGEDVLILRMDEDDKIVRGTIVYDSVAAKKILLTFQAHLLDKLENLRRELREII